MRLKLATLFFLSVPCFAEYGYCAPLTLTAATGSTQVNFTEAFHGSDVMFKTIANGGVIQHTSTRAGVTVPDDFVLTDDPTCRTVTGSYVWGFEDGGTVNGAPVGWVMVPSLTTSSPTIYAAIGNASVSTYQGGAQGSEFDSFTVGAWHFPNGTALSATDFTSFANDGALEGTMTAAAGKIDGAASFDGSSGDYILGADSTVYNVVDLYVSAWIRTSATGTSMLVVRDTSGGAEEFQFRLDGGKVTFQIFTTGSSSVYSVTGLVTVNDNAWHQVAGCWDGANVSVLVDGAVDQSTAGAGTLDSGSGTRLLFGQSASGVSVFTGMMDESKISGTARSSDWAATEYANQSSPPAIGAFSIIGPAQHLQLRGFGQ